MRAGFIQGKGGREGKREGKREGEEGRKQR